MKSTEGPRLTLEQARKSVQALLVGRQAQPVRTQLLVQQLALQHWLSRILPHTPAEGVLQVQTRRPCSGERR